MQLIDEVIGYAKGNADAARTSDEQDVWLAHHRNCLKIKTEIERMQSALKPFADAVYNDNGDMTIDHSGIGVDQFAKAYFVMRNLEE